MCYQKHNHTEHIYQQISGERSLHIVSLQTVKGSQCMHLCLTGCVLFVLPQVRSDRVNSIASALVKMTSVTVYQCIWNVFSIFIKY